MSFRMTRNRPVGVPYPSRPVETRAVATSFPPRYRVALCSLNRTTIDALPLCCVGILEVTKSVTVLHPASATALTRRSNRRTAGRFTIRRLRANRARTAKRPYELMSLETRNLLSSLITVAPIWSACATAPLLTIRLLAQRCARRTAFHVEAQVAAASG
jgi:hypothetical protein